MTAEPVGLLYFDLWRTGDSYSTAVVCGLECGVQREALDILDDRKITRLGPSSVPAE